MQLLLSLFSFNPDIPEISVFFHRQMACHVNPASFSGIVQVMRDHRRRVAIA
jgi:hypothetical protein